MEYIIGLDESGNFENQNKECRFIGGFVGNYAPTESDKIESLLKDICEHFNQKTVSKRKGYQVIYPNSLHGSGAVFYRQSSSVLKDLQALPKSERNRNYESMEEEFKRDLQDQVIEYLKKNNYEIYMFFDPYIEKGFDEIHTTSGNIVNRHQGANLYERMAILSMYNQIVYTTRDTAEHYHLHFATRTLENSKYSSEDLYEVYEVWEDGQKKKRGKITTMSTYKTGLATLLYDKAHAEEYQNAEYSFYVKSVNYNDRDKDKDKETTPFLYVADIVCSYIRRIWKDEFSVDFNKMKENVITSEQLLTIANKYNLEVRIYDGSEVYLRHMIENVRNAKLDQYYEELYELQHSDEKYRDYYLRYWMPKVEDYLHRLMKKEDYKMKVVQTIPEACTVTRGYMGPREYLPEKGLFIAQKLLSVLELIQDSKSRNRLGKSLFELYDICLSGYNHRGNLKDAKEMIEMGEVYKSYVDAETYIAHTLRTMQYYFDSFQFEKAMDIGIELVAPLRDLKYAYRAMYNVTNHIVGDITEEEVLVPEHHYILAGKVYSSIGQAAGFLGRAASGNRYFRKALDEFEVGSPDYAITTSYFLHHFIACNKKADYAKMAEAYFKSADLSEQFNDAIQNGGFKLLVFVKAFRVFYAKDSSNLHLLKEMIEQITSVKNTNAHPWELIYKNLYEAIILQQKALRLADYEFIKEMALTCVKHPDCTIRMIQIGFKVNTFLKTEKDAENMFAVDCLNEEELCICEDFIEAPAEMTLEELVGVLNKLLTYSYC